MPSRTARSYEERLIASVAEAIQGDADTMAAEMGAPVGQHDLSDATRVRLWGRRDPADLGLTRRGALLIVPAP